MSRQRVARLLESQGYSLQVNKKTVEGTQHPNWNAQKVIPYGIYDMLTN